MSDGAGRGQTWQRAQRELQATFGRINASRGCTETPKAGRGPGLRPIAYSTLPGARLHAELGARVDVQSAGPLHAFRLLVVGERAAGARTHLAVDHARVAALVLQRLLRCHDVLILHGAVMVLGPSVLCPSIRSFTSFALASTLSSALLAPSFVF